MNPASPASAVSRPAVLLVDDEALLMDALRAGLEGEFDVDVAISAAEAEPMLEARAYRIVVVDHLMPGEEGLQFLVRMKNRYPHVHRIMFTGYINPELLSRSVTLADLAACVVKPVRAVELGKVLRDTLEKPPSRS